MSTYTIRIVLSLLFMVGVLLGGCQPIQSEGANSQAEARIEQTKAEVLKHELGTFTIYINRDMAALEAETGAEFFSVGPDGSLIDRDAYIAFIAAEKFIAHEPDLGEMQVWMIAPLTPANN